MRGATLARVAALPLWAVGLPQGLRLRRRMPRLAAPVGRPSGAISGRGEVLTVLVVGESTVAGVGAATQEEALAAQLARAVARTTARPVRWIARGRIGLRVESALRRGTAETEGRSDVVVLVFGINDVLAGTGSARWRRAVASLIGVTRRNGEIPVVLAGVPPAGSMPALPQPLRLLLGLRARRLDDALAHLAGSIPGVVHVPTRLPGGVEYFSQDRLHPSTRGYREWGELLGASVAAVADRA